MKNILLTCLLVLSIGTNAQERCGVLQNDRRLYAQFPGLEAQSIANRQATLNAMKQLDLTKLEKNTRGQFIIPIVFHILHNYGNEWVLDKQVQEEMVYLNRNYSKTNTAELATIIPFWQDSAANCEFEFRLANKDPEGNCTNGIDRIYTAKTNEGDNTSKLNQWPNQYYLNVWVANAIRGDQGTGGTLAFALKPESVTGQGGSFFYDGIIMKHRWLGNSGTYAGNDHYTLTHEIGHYLGLDHTWGGSNNPTVTCGDDGVGDTPETEGHNNCSLAALYDTICQGSDDPLGSKLGILHNTQNFMEYSGCGAMYTKGQKALMVTNLEDYFSRGSLTDSLAHAYTGIANPPVSCKPIADYNSTRRFVCVGTATTIKDWSYNGTITSRQWSFPNGTATNPTAVTTPVTFSTPGWQDATLISTNTAGSDTLTTQHFYAADPNPVSIVGVGAGKTIQTFEGAGTYPTWPIFNYYNNNFKWEHEGRAGHNGGQSLRYQVYDLRNPFDQTTNTQDRDFDDIFTDAYDLSSLSGPKNINFWSAGASAAANATYWDPNEGANGAYVNQVKDSMNIHYSTDCGNNWRYMAGFRPSDLHNNGFVPQEFLPTTLAQWKANTVPIPAAIANSKQVFFRFRYFPSTGGNNFYMDDIAISNYTTGVEPVIIGKSVFGVYPNPSNGANINITISNDLVIDNIIQITDITGKLLYRETAETIVANGGNLSNSNTLSTGVYLVSVVSNGKVLASQKLVIQ